MNEEKESPFGPPSMHVSAAEAERMAAEPRLYTEFADWWPLLSSPDDYAEEAGIYAGLLQRFCKGRVRTLLELGSGGGNNAYHLQQRFAMTLVDRAPGMLAVSRRLNPACRHVNADMRSVRLGSTFDAVFVHDAIVYMTTRHDLRAVVKTAALHCRPGGAVLLAPDHTRENFRPTTGQGGGDDGQRGLRYLQWSHDEDPADSEYTTDFVYVLQHRDGSLDVAYDRHRCGLFSRREWLAMMHEEGFAAEAVPFEHSEVETGACEIFAGRKTASG